MVTEVEIRILIAELEESELVLLVADFVAKSNLVSLAEIKSLGKVSVKVRDVCFDFGFSHIFFVLGFLILYLQSIR